MSHLFQGTGYISHQSQVLLEYFQGGAELLEINGEFLHDEFFTQVFSGYEKHSQAKILRQLIKTFPNITLTYCISAKDLVRDKQFSQKYLSFEKYILKELTLITASLDKKAEIVITLMDDEFIPPHVRDLEKILQAQGYSTTLYPLGESYTITNPTIICSYSSQTGKSLLCQSTGKPYQNRSPLPLNISEHHPLNILAQAYGYTPQAHNLSVFKNYISDLSEDKYRASSKELINHHLKILQKLLLSGYSEEEEITQIKNLLIYLNN